LFYLYFDCNLLVDRWQGTFIIVGGILLNLTVCAALYRPLNQSLKRKNSKVISKTPPSTNSKEVVDDSPTLNDNSAFCENQIYSDNTEPKSCLDGESFQNTATATLSFETTSLIGSQHQEPISRTNECSETAALMGSQNQETSVRTDSLATNFKNAPVSAKNTTYQQTTHNAETGAEISTLPQVISSQPRPQNCCAKVASYFDLNLLLRPVFITYLIALTLATMAYLSAQNLVMAHAIDNGVEPYLSVLVLSIVGVSDTLGRILSGFIYDIPFVRRRRGYLYSFILLGSGLSILGWAFCSSFVALAILSVSNGVFNGAIVAGRPVIVADLVGMSRMTSAFGMTVFCQGAGVVIGPFIAGKLDHK